MSSALFHAIVKHPSHNICKNTFPVTKIQPLFLLLAAINMENISNHTVRLETIALLSIANTSVVLTLKVLEL